MLMATAWVRAASIGRTEPRKASGEASAAPGCYAASLGAGKDGSARRARLIRRLCAAHVVGCARWVRQLGAAGGLRRARDVEVSTISVLRPMPVATGRALRPYVSAFLERAPSEGRNLEFFDWWLSPPPIAYRACCHDTVQDRGRGPRARAYMYTLLLVWLASYGAHLCADTSTTRHWVGFALHTIPRSA